MPSRFQTIRLDAKTIRRDSNGFVKLPARVTRVGVFNYRKSDGSILRELRPPEEVFHADSMESLKSIPITNDHPDKLLDAKTAKKHTVGWTGDTVSNAEDKYLDTTATIVDHDTIVDVESGKEELSLGYSVDHYDETPGEWNGIAYDRIQRGIRYNHLSVVDRGRAGPSVKLRLDAMDAEMITDEDPLTPKEVPPMPKLKIGDKEFEASQDVCDAVNAKISEMDGAAKKQLDDATAKVKADGEKELAKEIGEKAELQKKLDAADAKVVVLEKDVKEKLDAADPKKIEALVAERIDLLKVAKNVKEGMKFDGLSNEEIKKAIVAEAFPKTKLDGRSQEFVDGLFESVAKEGVRTNPTIEKLGTTLAAKLDGAEVGSAEAARKRAQAESRDAWKQPLNGKGA